MTDEIMDILGNYFIDEEVQASDMNDDFYVDILDILIIMNIIIPD